MKRSLFALMFVLCISLLGIQPAHAASTVTSEAELRQALASGETEITTTGTITITQSLMITQGTVTMNVERLNLAEGVNSMFVISSGAHLKLVGGTLDGQQHGRLIETLDGSSLSIDSSTLTNGSTDSFEKKLVNGTNEQRYQGGAIWANHATINLVNTNFTNNHTKHAAPVQEPDKQPAINTHGGAIYAGASSVTITGGSFIDNYSGGNEGGVYYGEGGAIKLEVSTLKMNETGATRTRFDGNHNYMAAANRGGLQGGALEITESNGVIRNADFVVKGGFDTGGAIKFQESGQSGNHFKVQDSTFKLIGKVLPTAPVTSGYFGTSGGAIMSESSYLTVERSHFSMQNTPSVSFAGGHIDVVGTGEFKLLESTLLGNGVGWNEAWRSSAKYGGALAFENGCSVVAEIRNTNFTGFTTDHVGGVIAVGHRVGGEPNDAFGHTTVKLNMYKTNLNDARAYTWDAKAAGAGMYISEGSELVMSGGSIANMQANYAGAIFNKGKVTLIDGATIQNNSATQMVGGIFNDGYLNVHSAVLKNNTKTTDTLFAGGNHELSSGEHSGGTIYAKRDVIIGSDARFDTNARADVRVINGQSAVLLSGARTSQLNISISETENNPGGSQFSKLFGEPAHRHLGYVVARGVVAGDLTASYMPDGVAAYELTPNDAKSLHYVSKTVAQDKIAAFSDHIKPALWDYVYNPETKTAVLGQRAVMTYHTNHADATIEAGVADTTGQKREQTYTFYAPHKVSLNDKPATDLTVLEAKPELSINNVRYTFRNWYTDAALGKPLYDVATHTPADSDVYPFETATFRASWSIPDEVTDIINPASHNTLHTYAVYDALMTVEVGKTWQDTLDADKQDVTFVLKGGAAEQEKTLSANSTERVRFENLPRFKSDGSAYNYRIEEKGAANGVITLGGKMYSSEVSEPEVNGNVTSFTVTNQRIINLKVTKHWQAPNSDKTPVQVQLMQNGVAYGNPVTVNEDSQWTYDFTSLPHAGMSDSGRVAYTYTVKEVGETDGSLTLGDKKFKVSYGGSAADGFTITNTRELSSTPITPATTSLTVVKRWERTTATAPIKVQLMRDGVAQGDPVELSATNNWTHRFDQLPVQAAANSTKAYTYTVAEVGEQGGKITLGNHSFAVAYTTTANNRSVLITNTMDNPTKSITVNKTWVDGANAQNTRPQEVEVQLLANGQVTEKVAHISAATNWQYSFEGLPTYAEDGSTIAYTVQERPVAGYASEIQGNAENGFTFVNTLHTAIKVTKTWRASEADKSPVSIQLQRADGTNIGSSVTLNDTNQWSYTFKDLPAAELKEDADTAITYTVKEVGETDGSLTLGDKKFKVSYGGSAADGFTITNTRELSSTPITPATTSLTVVKRWERTTATAPIKVQLMRDGVAQGDPVELSATNNWTHRFDQLPVQAAANSTKAYTYTVAEVGEQGGKITLEGTEFTVGYELSDDNHTVTITNTAPEQTPPPTPEPEPEPMPHPNPEPQPAPNPNPEPSPSPAPTPKPQDSKPPVLKKKTRKTQKALPSTGDMALAITALLSVGGLGLSTIAIHRRNKR
ncbi:Cna B-type domain-containing protein [Collinsella sp. zg1085]|uniref:Cna B-type domain-containing protein n=1 Tax=Collinsella sp. zg1085 TaxID=2844380 RepID=UPI001C0E85B4|nr:Cna B-type domain-containing protein [Collinsella sp. zg1085]QWT17926.1 Cna B-type domain-containing protein [Collinsella sp. zg1085]